MAGAKKASRKGMISKKKQEEAKQSITFQLTNPLNLEYSDISILRCHLILDGVSVRECLYTPIRGNKRVLIIATEYKTKKSIVLEIFKNSGTAIR